MNNWITNAWLSKDAERVWRRQTTPIVPPFAPCPACDHGWILTSNTRGPYFRRCACWEAHQRRVTAILAGKGD